ncbi:SDR family NAD(P)-dependent oxidoreductase [Acidiluteibacter ferrifornacis]|uniref:SDR family NAD(P)-dependent oxidoreductase n=1 Tax=Acidiluteibacter ferrifornacis TaxID=2692424 RepID=A0A6N9NLE3_9FLAO|nr:SDR family oxidoreductase [Acidiluteibacter ferrifornacis]NBG66704.1 SDR family NAD(P)-dependent oxidoreductase [Acidiluteibacter ferrifornacis]
MNVIITGASQGLGFELVLRFCSLYPEVNMMAIARSVDKLNNLKSICKNKYGIDITTEKIDFNSENFHLNIKEKFSKQFDSVDILINNSAILFNKAFPENTYYDALTIYKVNTLAPYFLTQALLPLLKKSVRAHVVNISSMGGFQGSSKFPGLSLYSSSKAALSNITECLAEELLDTSINVNALALGSINTEMLRNAFPGYISPNSPADMASYICDFAVNAGSVYNGKVLPVSNSTP